MVPEQEVIRMYTKKVSPLRVIFSHLFMVIVGSIMLLPFLWSLATSLKSSSEVFKDNNIPSITTLGTVDGKEITTKQDEKIYIALPTEAKDKSLLWSRGKVLRLRIGNPTLQGEGDDRAITRDGEALLDEKGAPILNNQVDGKYDKWVRYQGFRLKLHYMEPVLVPRDFDNGRNEELAKKSFYYSRYLANWEEMVEKRWNGKIPLILTKKLRDYLGSKGKVDKPFTIDNKKIVDKRKNGKDLYYSIKYLTWREIGNPVRLLSRPAKIVRANGLPILYESPFPIYRTEDDPLYYVSKSKTLEELKVFVGDSKNPVVLYASDINLEKNIRLLWANYSLIFADPQIKLSLFAWNSFFVAFFVVFLNLVTSSLAAFAFARLEWPGRDKLFFAYLATMMIPGIVIQIPNYMILKELGWINTFYALIIPSASTAYGTFLLRQYMLTLPKSLEEAARIDGASLLRVWWDIVLPLSRPAIITLAIFTFSSVWQNFSGPLIFAPEENVRVLSVAIYNLSSEYSQSYNILMAASIMMILPMLLLFIFGQKYFVRGLQLGSVKG